MSDETLQLLKAFIDAAGYEVRQHLVNPRTGEKVEPIFGQNFGGAYTDSLGSFKPEPAYTVTKKKRKPRSQAKESAYSAGFLGFWSGWKAKGKGSKQDAYKQFTARFNGINEMIDRHNLYHKMVEGRDNYLRFCRETGQFSMQVCRFLGKGKHYLNDYTIPDSAKRQNRVKQEWEVIPENDNHLAGFIEKHGFKQGHDRMDKVFDTRRKLQAQIKQRIEDEINRG